MTANHTPMRLGLGQFVNADQLRIIERSSDAGCVVEGTTVWWMSDGTGAGDDGDTMKSIRAGCVTKTTIETDFSALP